MFPEPNLSCVSIANCFRGAREAQTTKDFEFILFAKRRTLLQAIYFFHQGFTGESGNLKKTICFIYRSNKQHLKPCKLGIINSATNVEIATTVVCVYEHTFGMAKEICVYEQGH